MKMPFSSSNNNLNEMAPVYLNTGAPIGGTVWERSGSEALLEEVCHQGRLLGFQKTIIFPY